MNPEYWKKVKVIIEEVLELAPEMRFAYLAEACGADHDLRREVDSLLEFEEENLDLVEEGAFFAVLNRDTIDKTAQSLIGSQIGHYRIISELGAGGMGTVFLAERADGTFEQQAALKLIKRGMNSDAILRRFFMERQILASLNHPNIAHLIDGGTTDEGLPYFVLEYVEGEMITDYATRANLDLEERLKLFREVCQAVSFAHSNLIIHRDLKPSNILIHREGSVKLLDFGIAKLLKSEMNSNLVTATQNFVLTPEYASPEQVRGEKLTTATDIYSLGVILYELLTGNRPYKTTGQNIGEIIKAVCDTEPERPSIAAARSSSFVLRPSQDDENVTSIHHPQKTNDDNLNAGNNKRRTKNAGLRTKPEGQRTNPKSLRGDLDNIILKALRKEPERRYKSVEQFSEDIRRHLDGLPVMARKDTVIYRSSKFFQRHFVNNWQSAFVPAMVFVLLAAIGLGSLSFYWVRIKAESVAPVMENKYISRHEIVSQAAHEAYLKGRFLLNKRTAPEVQKAIELFNQAITIEPSYAEAYAAISDSYILLAMSQPKNTRREMIEKARQAALRTIEIDATLAEPHASLGFIAYDYDWNWETAEKEYRRAIELNPNYPTAHHWFAYLLQNIGRHDEAIAEINRARELDPLSAPIARDVAEILNNARRFDEAIEQLRKRIELDENDVRVRSILAMTLRQQGRYQESIDESLKLIDKTNRAPETLIELAGTYLAAGRKAEAQKLIREAQQRGLKEFPLEFYAALCNKDKMFEWIEEKYNNRDGLITNLKVLPTFDCIRSDPRYTEMIHRIGLP